MNKLFINNVGDLSEIQRASFYRFLHQGITQELGNFPNPFITKVKVPTRTKRKLLQCFVYLYPKSIKLKGPTLSIDTSLKKDVTYSIQLFVSSEYSYEFNEKLDTKNLDLHLNTSRNRKEIQKIRVKQDILFGEIPLMTEEGTFIINGCERVVISQIIRSPGIYFRKEFGTTRKTSYTATIISDKGLWSKIHLSSTKEKNSNENFEEIEEKKDEIYIKLTDFKIYKTKTLEKKRETDERDKIYLYDLIKYFGLTEKEILGSTKYPLQLKNQKLRRGLAIFPEELFSLFDNIFLSQRSGCFSIGEIGRYKVNKKLGLNLPKDITYLTAQDFIAILDALIELKYYDRISDDIDHMKNKQIRAVGELLQGQIRVALYKLAKTLDSDNLVQRNNFELENESNPDEWIIDPRPLTNTIKDFFKTSQLSQFLDQINPLSELTHKRRISVFGPNGLKRDNISTVIRDIHPSQYGKLCPVETPEGQNAGLITSISMFGRVSSLGWIETPYFLLKNSIVYSNKHAIYLNPEQESETKIVFSDNYLKLNGEINSEYLSTKENYYFSLKKNTDVNFVTTSPLQIISLATALIPFIEHDDANRALMGSNMQRQAVPLLYPQKPLVGTGLETAAILDSALVTKTYCEGEVLFSSSNVIHIMDKANQKISYYLRKYVRSNQETCINQRPIVWPGEKVYSNQIIADGPGTCDGELALGRNLTIAYMPWEGYNYEDAIIINERLIIENCLTSIHIEEYETSLSNYLMNNENITNNLPHLTKYIRRHLDADGIAKIGSYVKDDDILVGKMTPCEEDNSAQGKLLKAIFGEPKVTFRDTSLRASNGTEGRIIDIRIISSSLINPLNKEELALSTFSETIRIYIAQVRKIQIGDKLAGRHGNKGIISRVLSRQDMPYLPDGTPIDIIFNPLGVPSRMNVGQVLESLLGLAGEKLGKRYKISPFDEIYGKEASRVLINQKLKQAAIQTNLPWLFSTSSPGKILIRDGRTGEFFDNPVTVGKAYILKLIHLVEDKIHARATGPYSMITEQPLSGKAQKGGQRFGEMEVWALEAHGCSNTLQELLTIKSDDIDGRNDMYESLLVRKRIEKPSPSIPEAFLAMMRELHSLGLDFSMQKFENGFYSTTDIKPTGKDIFKDIENRLKLRALLSQKKAEQFSRVENNINFSDENEGLRINEKQKILKDFKF